jgi:VCBS repeat-containing protein
MRQDKVTRDTDQLMHSFTQQNDAELEQATPQPLPTQDTEDSVEEIIDVYFVRREVGQEEAIVDSAVQKSPQAKLPYASFIALAVNILALSVLLVAILPQLTSSVTITLIPLEKQVSATGTIKAVSGVPTTGQIPARFLPSLTLTQAKRAVATGHGHQSATQAHGFLTLYNGQSAAYAIALGTVFTGGDGVQVATDSEVTIPPGNPPSYGQATVSAHAISPGEAGNIASGDINTTIATAVFVKNSQFTGGQNERSFTYVTQADIQSAATPLTTLITRSENAALQAQLTSDEALLRMPCAPSVRSSHQAGQEASDIVVTVSENCSGVAYIAEALQREATRLLTSQVVKTLGTAYRLFGQPQVTILHGQASTHSPDLASIAVGVKGAWIYQIIQEEQEKIKRLVAGKSKGDALHLLSALPGIKNASIQWSGFGDDTTLPKDEERIHFHLLIGV